jgi:rhodanese-related sulfurtransferase
MNRARLLPLLALALGLAAPSAAREPYGTMSMDEVERGLGQPGFAVFDANVPELWEKNHLPGATHIVGKDLAQLLPADKGTRLVFYCTSPK